MHERKASRLCRYDVLAWPLDALAKRKQDEEASDVLPDVVHCLREPLTDVLPLLLGQRILKMSDTGKAGKIRLWYHLQETLESAPNNSGACPPDRISSLTQTDSERTKVQLYLRGNRSAGGKSVRGNKLKLAVDTDVAGSGLTSYLSFGCCIALHSGYAASLLQVAYACFW